MIGTDAGIARGTGAMVETASQNARGIDGKIESIRLVQVNETAITADSATLSYFCVERSPVSSLHCYLCYYITPH
jgi:hypothetical protein